MSPNGHRSERSETSMAALVAASQPRASLVLRWFLSFVIVGNAPQPEKMSFLPNLY